MSTAAPDPSDRRQKRASRCAADTTTTLRRSPGQADRASEQEHAVRAACADNDAAATVAVDETDMLGFVAVVVYSADASGEIDMIAVDPAAAAASAAP